jgi:hypothetical protein
MHTTGAACRETGVFSAAIPRLQRIAAAPAETLPVGWAFLFGQPALARPWLIVGGFALERPITPRPRLRNAGFALPVFRDTGTSPRSAGFLKVKRCEIFLPIVVAPAGFPVL